ncbi:hypothetical protein FA15DRAFT_611017 [Coprinopsis marcescibilis]|uniref:MYND-type domain-containing protein n=1 Tax=Coprinopsis marcescibilis TaxID=230819 RepID=A0A5C3LA87_COPMA|nr:hypothetical protein FA15DRAFT_611017 [Coprinopsis marcescibilis]
MSAKSSVSTEMLLDVLKNPHDPIWCGTGIRGLVADCVATADLELDEEQDSETNMWKFVRNTQAMLQSPKPSPKGCKMPKSVWQALYNMIFYSRNNDQVRKLIDAFNVCRCQERYLALISWAPEYGKKIMLDNLRYYHAMPDGVLDNGLESSRAAEEYPHRLASPSNTLPRPYAEIQVVTYLFKLIYDYLSYRKMKPLGQGECKTWPTSLDDLIPYGPDNLVRTIMSWYQVFPSTKLFAIFSEVLRVGADRLVPTIVRLNFSKFLVNAWKTHFDYAFNKIKSGTATPAVIRAYIQSKQDIKSLLHVLVMTESFSSQRFEQVFEGCEIKLIQLCSLTSYLNQHPLVQEQVKGSKDRVLEWIAQVTYRYFHLHRYIDIGLLLHPSIVRMDQITFPWDKPVFVEEFVIKTVMRLRSESRCTRWGCTNSIHAAGRAQKRCSLCGVAVYCCKPCQAGDWKDKRFPHRKLCPLLAGLVKAAGEEGVSLLDLADVNRKKDGRIPRKDVHSLFEEQSEEKFYEYPLDYDYVEVAGRLRASGYPQRNLKLLESWVDTFPTRYGPKPPPTLSQFRQFAPGFFTYERVLAEFVRKYKAPPAREMDRSKGWNHEASTNSAISSSSQSKDYPLARN